MKIAVLSGKGGTGKTLVSVNLAAVAPEAAYLDCDVEEPNGYLFFKPSDESIKAVEVRMPVVDPVRCTGCRRCVDFCRFNALAHVPGGVVVFEEICHSCGGCGILCPSGAIFEKQKPMGQIRSGSSGGVRIVTGILNVGEASGVPVIKAVLDTHNDGLAIIDCPPGSACTVMESIREADYCILVAEPSVFGAGNLEMVHELVRLFEKPHGIVLNKCNGAENPSEAYALDQGIEIIGRIPYDSGLGLLHSEGRIAVRESRDWGSLFLDILEKVKGGRA